MRDYVKKQLSDVVAVNENNLNFDSVLDDMFCEQKINMNDFNNLGSSVYSKLDQKHQSIVNKKINRRLNLIVNIDNVKLKLRKKDSKY